MIDLSRMDWQNWLIDRNLHRQPVNTHFLNAFAWLRTTPPAAISPILELGPGPEFDLTDALRAEGREVWTADTAPAREGAQDIRIEDELPFEMGQFGTVLAREVFEHVFDLNLALSDTYHVLMPGGRLWFSSVLMFPLHDYETGDYWRITAKGWERLLAQAGFAEWKVWHDRLLFNSWQFPVSVLGWAQR